MNSVQRSARAGSAGATLALLDSAGHPRTRAAEGRLGVETLPTSTRSAREGVAHITRTHNAGERHQMVEGKIKINGNVYDFRSGGSGRGSLPKGSYVVTPFKNTTNQAGMVKDGVGYSFALTDKFDPRVGDTRSLLRIRPTAAAQAPRAASGSSATPPRSAAFAPT